MKGLDIPPTFEQETLLAEGPTIHSKQEVEGDDIIVDWVKEGDHWIIDKKYKVSLREKIMIYDRSNDITKIVDDTTAKPVKTYHCAFCKFTASNGGAIGSHYKKEHPERLRS